MAALVLVLSSMMTAGPAREVQSGSDQATWYREQVRDVVAEVSHEDCGALLHVNDLSPRVRRPADDVQLFAMRNDLVRRPVRNRHELRVIKAPDQVDAELQLAA
mgnify:CR=1 FL=1